MVLSALLCGCSSFGTDDSKTVLVPNKTLNVSRSLSIPVESMVAGGLLYLAIDPLAPNWRIEQTQLDAERYRISLRKKRFTTGGDGEATQVFYRRAEQIAREAGTKGYRVLEFSEGVDSVIPIAQRIASGVVEVIR
jgi:hypothetical protein